MGELEKAEGTELEEELKHAFSHRKWLWDHLHSSINPSQRHEVPSGWHRPLPLPTATRPRSRRRGAASERGFEETVRYIQSALSEITAQRLSEILGPAQREAAAALREPVGSPGLEGVTARLEEVERGIEGQRRSRNSIIVPVTTFAPEPYLVQQTIYVVVQPLEDQYMASFFDANVHTTGDTDQESVDNLKTLILDIFESLVAEPANSLGADAARQLAVLHTFLRRIS